MSPKTLRRAKTPKKAKILRSKFIYKGPIFGVRRDEVLEPNGVRAMREVITHPGSVVVLQRLPTPVGATLDVMFARWLALGDGERLVLEWPVHPLPTAA